MSVVELRELFRVHRTPEGDAAALQGLSLDVDRGELVCVLGPSGAGKSTLLRVIAGIELPSAGVARVLGRDVGRLSQRSRTALRRSAIGFLDERSDRSLVPDLTAAQCVTLPMRLRGASLAQWAPRVDELLEAVGLAGRRNARPDELSGGERQRLALCAALAHRPRLLLADEPTGELDADSARTVRGMLASLVRAEDASAIVVSHDSAAARDADRVIHLRDGRVVEDRRAKEDGHADGASLLVGRGGWVRLPAELLLGSGVPSRVVAKRVAGGLLVTPASSPAEYVPKRAENIPTPAQSTISRAERRFPPALLEARDVNRRFGRGPSERIALNALSHKFATSQLTVVTGRSGSGKTTLLQLLCGLDRPDRGSVLIDEQPLGEDRERLAAIRRARIGYLAQEPAPIPFLSPTENVVLGLALRGWKPAAAAQRASEALTEVGLAERERQRVSRLSAGERQRVALARALACADGLLVVDEPTSRLDEAMTESVAQLLVAAASDRGQTVVCASHDELVIARADAVLEL